MPVPTRRHKRPNPGEPSGNVENRGRNILDALGLRDVDLALAWTFRFTERVHLQFRGEASNAFNIVSLGTPGTTVSAPSSFGIIRSAQPMRQVQLGSRLLFLAEHAVLPPWSLVAPPAATLPSTKT